MAFASKQGSRGGRFFSEINVTPLTDVFLVLLVIFMITTSAMIRPAANVRLPRAPQNDEPAKGVLVTLTPDRRTYVNERPVSGDDAELVAVLRDALAKSREKVVVLAGDKRVVLGEVVHVLSLAREAGAAGFALASE